MTITNSEEYVAERLPAHDDPSEVAIERRLTERFDRNFVTIDRAYSVLNSEIQALKKRPAKPPRRHIRHGSAARVDPDDWRAGRVIIGLTVVFALASFAASFSGQLAMAPYTRLPNHLQFVVPLFIDLPVAYLSWMALILRRRKQSAGQVWVLLWALTLVSSTVNTLHVLIEAGAFDGAELVVGDFVGATIMGLAPILVLISWHQLSKLLVKPMGEKKDPTSADLVKVTPRARSKK